MPGAIRFESPTSEALVCSCGNTQRADGFEPCDPQGYPVEPIVGGPWVGHYRCGRCGAYALPRRTPAREGVR
jgi:hypothetical protein